MMQVECTKLFIIFLIIMGSVLLKRSLNEAVFLAIASTVLLFRIPINQTLSLSVHSVFEKDTLIVLGSYFFITFLQRIMEKLNLLKKAETSLERISGNRRVVCMFAPAIMEFLPSVGVVNICGQIIEDIIGYDFSAEDKTFLTSHYMHISESFSPTYSATLLALSITSVPTGKFVLGMFPMVLVLLFLGYLFGLKKIDKGYHRKQMTSDKMGEFKQLIYCFWPLVACIAAVVVANLSVLQVLPVIILLAIMIYQIEIKDIPQLLKGCFEKKIIINTIILMIFKNILTSTEVIEILPQLFERSCLPQFVAFGLIMLFGIIIGGTNEMIVLVIPLAFMTITNAVTALLVFLMAIAYAGSQLSPTHICLSIAADYFHVPWGELFKRTLRIMIVFVVIVHFYYLLLVRCGI